FPLIGQLERLWQLNHQDATIRAKPAPGGGLSFLQRLCGHEIGQPADFSRLLQASRNVFPLSVHLRIYLVGHQTVAMILFKANIMGSRSHPNHLAMCFPRSFPDRSAEHTSELQS